MPLTELIPIRSSEAAKLDVIFVHGLNGDAIQTWEFDKPQSWADWLSSNFAVNIWTLSYRIRSSRWTGGSMPLSDRAKNVLATLDGILSTPRPILFVCHSYGGLLVKQMLNSALHTWAIYRPLASRIKGVVFLGTPNTGSSVANYFDIMGKIIRTSEAIEELRVNEAAIRELNDWFRNFASEGLEILVFAEDLKTGPFIVVDVTSADPHWPSVPVHVVDANHTELAKPRSPGDLRVTQTKKLIERLLHKSSSSKSLKIDHTMRDAAVFYRTCFDRPAFSTPFAREVHGEDFERAVEDTITALKTGNLRDRRRGDTLLIGPPIARLEREVVLEINKITSALGLLLEVYRASKSRNNSGAAGIRIFEYQGNYYKPDRDIEAEAVIDRARMLILAKMNVILDRFGVEPLSMNFDVDAF